MRIACYYPWVYLRSGIERTILETCRRSRHEYTIFTNHYEPENTYPEFADLNIVELAHVPVERQLAAVLRGATTIALQKIDLSAYDLLLVQCDGIGSLVLNRSSQIPAACICHTPMRPVYDPEYRVRALDRLPAAKRLAFHAFSMAFGFVDRIMWLRYKHVFFASGEGKARAQKGGLLSGIPSRYEVLHTGIDTAALQPTGIFDHYFLLPGRIMWTKNIELALRGFIRFKSLSPSARDFRLVIAGMVDKKSQEYYAKLKAIAAGREDVDFVMTPSDAELRQLYARSYGVLFPAFNEDWGLVPLEANACGKPVIACDRGGPKESQQHGQTGFLVEPDPQAFANAMALLAADPELAKDMGVKGRENARKYDWSHFVNRMDDVLESVANEANGAATVTISNASALS